MAEKDRNFLLRDEGREARRRGRGEGVERVEERHHGQRVAGIAMKTEEEEEESCRSATAARVLLYRMAVFGF